MPRKFRWLIKGRLAGMAVLMEGDKALLQRRCDWLRVRKFRTIISLEKSGAEDTRDVWTKLGRRSDRDFAWYESFLHDFNAPSAAQLAAFVRTVEERREQGGVAVHCGGGTGRTGCFLAAYQMFVKRSSRWRASTAVRSVRRRYNEDAVELMIQYNALGRYGDTLSPPVRSGRFDGSSPTDFDLRYDQSGIRHDPGHDGDDHVRTAHGHRVMRDGRPLRRDPAPNRQIIAVSARAVTFSSPRYVSQDPRTAPRGSA